MGKIKTVSLITLPALSILLYYLFQHGDVEIHQSMQINVPAEIIADFWGDFNNVQPILPILEQHETLEEVTNQSIMDGEYVDVVTSKIRCVEKVFAGLSALEYVTTRLKYDRKKGIYHSYVVDSPLGKFKTVFFMKRIDGNKTLVEESSHITLPKILLPYAKSQIATNHIELMKKMKQLLE